MTSNQIRYFLEVAKCENYTQAAERLGVSHQIISTQIKALEKELGIELINRKNRRRIRLTDAGTILFEAWTQAAGVHEKAVQQAKRLQETDRNSLVIGIQDMRFVRSYVVPLIRKMQDAPRKIDLEYRLGSPEELIQMLQNDQVDMLIMISSDINTELGYHSAILQKEALHLVAAVSKDHPLANRKKLKFEDLKDETILMIAPAYSSRAYQSFQKDLEQHHMMVQNVKYYNGPRAINIAVETGDGVAVLFDELLEEARDEIKTFPMDLSNAKKVDMVLVWKDPENERHVKRMIELQSE